MRDKLASLIAEAEAQINNDLPTVEYIADYLIEHGVVVKGYEYFSPQQVRNMSPKEVHENYSAIMRSMKEWK
jgi:hypothetical protein